MKALEKFTGIKVNKSLIARDLGVSRKTALKYYNGYVPSKKDVEVLFLTSMKK